MIYANRPHFTNILTTKSLSFIEQLTDLKHRIENRQVVKAS